MNTEDITLPELSDQRIEEIEASLFAQISRERRDALAGAERARVRSVRRGRVWMGVAAAATIVAVAAIIAPQFTAGGGPATSFSTADQPVSPADGAREQALPGAADGSTTSSGGDAGIGTAGDGASSQASSDVREIVATASATVLVGDARAAADAITGAATRAGGFVESMSLGSAGVMPTDPVAGVAPDQVGTILPTTTGAWITVRVPADQLTPTLASLAEVGEVTATQIDRRDVTTEAVDLRARVASLETSVTRLTALMAQATSTADLIAAESALAARQAELDSLRQQLTWLDGQIGMSTLTVTLTERTTAVAADPAGFGDGVAAGWNGLVATLNGLVIAVGFLIPWLGVLIVAGLVIWGIRRAVRRRRARTATSAQEVNGVQEDA